MSLLRRKKKLHRDRNVPSTEADAPSFGVQRQLALPQSKEAPLQDYLNLGTRERSLNFHANLLVICLLRRDLPIAAAP